MAYANVRSGHRTGVRRAGHQQRWAGALRHRLKQRSIGGVSSSLGKPGGEEFTRNAGYPGSIPVSGRTPGERNGKLFQYSSLENSMAREACRATVHGVAEVDTT